MDTEKIEPKLCECGCGLPAPLASKTSKSDGRIKGQPMKFIRGHNARVLHGQVLHAAPVRQRFESKIEKTSTCWLWRGTVYASGYGEIGVKVNGKWKNLLAHRVSYEFYKGQLMPGDTVDHLCMNPLCVNPAHLEAVSTGENSRRSPRTLQGQNVRKTHCPQGHPYSGDNLFYDQGKRKCRECVRAKNRRNDARRRAKRKEDALR